MLNKFATWYSKCIVSADCINRILSTPLIRPSDKKQDWELAIQMNYLLFYTIFNVK